MIRISDGNIQYELNEEDNTAKVYHTECYCTVKRSVTFDSKEYLVVGIKEGCLHNEIMVSEHYLEFDHDVQINSIEKNTFINAPYIMELSIPPSIKELKDGWCKSTECLNYIFISPENENFKLIDCQLMVGKTNIKNKDFDDLLFCIRKIVYVNIPPNITRISSFSFSNCFKLKFFEIPENSKLYTICHDAFNGSPIRYLFIPSQLAELKNGWCANTPILNEICISPKNKHFKLIEEKMIVGKSCPDSEVYDVLEFACRDIEEAKIPSCIKYISPFCFEKCKRLKSIRFNDDSNITIIGNDAFGKTHIESLYIPAHLTELKKGWCANIPNLNEIYVSSKNKHFKLIEEKMIVGKSCPDNEVYDVLEFACRDIEEAKIPSYIKYISPFCFEKCRLLQKVQFSKDSKLISIGKYAFSQSLIESITIPKYCEQIQEGAFFKCDYLQSIIFHEDSKLQIIDEKAFSNSSLISIKIPKHVKTIKRDAFSDCHLLINATFHKNSELNFIGQQSFMNSSLIEIKIPDQVKEIDRKAFYQCRCLKDVYFPENSQIVSIGDYAFFNTSIKNVYIPSKTKFIRVAAFAECNELENVSFGHNSELFYISKNAFFLDPIKKIVVPASVKFIDNEAFFGEFDLQLEYETNSNIRKLNNFLSFGNSKRLFIPDNVKEIEVYDYFDEQIAQISLSPRNTNFKIIDEKIIVGKSDQNKKAFDILIFACRDIDKVKIPSQIKRISSHCFEKCNKLTTVEFEPNSNLISIDEKAFESSMIENIIIPNHVKTIGKNAFCNCQNLKSIKISDDSELEFIDEDAFEKTSIKSIFLPKNFKPKSLQLFSNAIEFVSVSAKNKNIKVINDKMIVEKSEENKEEFDTLVFGFRDITCVTIPKYIKYISQYCFYNCQKLKKINFEKNSELISIGKKAFENSSIENISIPYQLKKIESSAFSSTKKLKTVIFPNNTEIEIIEERAFEFSSINSIKYPDNLTTIEKDVFLVCDKLNSIQFTPNSKLTKIKRAAFAGSNIIEIRIPSHVKTIGFDAFARCENLKTVIFDKDSELTKIKCGAFQNSGIEKIIIPRHVKLIFPCAFSNCINLTKVEFQPNSELETIYDLTFNSISAQKIQIPKSVKKIIGSSFAKNANLIELELDENSEINTYSVSNICDTSISQIYIPSKVYDLDVENFYGEIDNLKRISISPKNKYLKSLDDDQIIIESSKKNSYDTLLTVCPQIENVIIPSHIKYISAFCFYDRQNIKRIEFPENSKLQTIYNGAFSKTNIEEITIPPHIQSISKTFRDCENLKVVDFASNSELRKIGKLTFSHSKIEKLFIPTNVVELKDGWCSNITNLTQILISPKNKNFKLIENKMIVGKSNPKSDVFDVLEFACRDIKEAKIPSDIKYISSYCFENCKKLEIIEFPQNSQLIKIGKNGFANSSISHISIPKHCKYIYENCFKFASQLKNIEFHINSEIECISYKSFASSNISSITIPSKVFLTRPDAFFECFNLNSVSVLGDFVCLQNDTFNKCNNLSFIEFPNASKIQIYSKTFVNSNIMIFINHGSQISFH
ncbi:hypothetical protein M9Y10_029847 [Tritrichomonas musculus]|uniref:Surface antigen BspA-like n=1 Tax=Tritrichomonas musculus TaxID=1915356 RepID=A0ABR2KP40_9EUKA